MTVIVANDTPDAIRGILKRWFIEPRPNVFVGTINRVGTEELGDDDFYGQSYFCDPRGQIVGGVASPHEEELVVRDLDLDLVTEVRQTWQFYRDRRPDAYGDLVRP